MVCPKPSLTPLREVDPTIPGELAEIMGSLYEEMAKAVGDLPADQLGAQAGELKASLSESLPGPGEGGTAPTLPSEEVKEGLRGLFEGVRSSE